MTCWKKMTTFKTSGTTGSRAERLLSDKKEKHLELNPGGFSFLFFKMLSKPDVFRLTSGTESFKIAYTSKLDSRAWGAKGPHVRKVRAPQGKDNG